ncbi:hypothetical protein, partial [Halobacillus litoralis]|uniref:hypothetical protein n=1 Tax=Halobacillus litoralis TaxID=45668 RepID=UPI001CD1DFF7
FENSDLIILSCVDFHVNNFFDEVDKALLLSFLATNTNLSRWVVNVNNFFCDLFRRLSTPHRSFKATFNNLSRMVIEVNNFFVFFHGVFRSAEPLSMRRLIIYHAPFL